eukprot:UN02983
MDDFEKLFTQSDYMGIPKSLAIEASKVLDTTTDIVKITEYIFKEAAEKKNYMINGPKSLEICLYWVIQIS